MPADVIGDDWVGIKSVREYAFAVFSIGVALSFITPLGWIVEASGVGAFLVWFTDRVEDWSPNFEDSIALWFGLYVAILSVCVSFASLVRPIGVNCGERPGLLGRTLTIWSAEGPKQGVARPSSSRYVGLTFGMSTLFAGVLVVLYGIVVPEAATGAGIRFQEQSLVDVFTTMSIVWGLILATLGIGTALLTILLFSENVETPRT